MSVLGAINLMFVDCLKEQVKGWQICPLAQYLEESVAKSMTMSYANAMSNRASRWVASGRFLRTHTVGSEQSPNDLIRKYPPKVRTFILLKAPKKPLRILTLYRDEQKIIIKYHGANGYKQTLEPIHGWRAHTPGPDTVENITIYEIWQMYRVTYRRKRGNIYHEDWFRPADPSSMIRSAALAIMMLEKSFGVVERLTKRRRNNGVPIGIDLEFTEPLNISEWRHLACPSNIRANTFHYLTEQHHDKAYPNVSVSCARVMYNVDR